MADREGEHREGEHRLTDAPEQPRGSESGTEAGDAGRKCPECGSVELTMLRDAALVSVYKCARCGHLLAPIKRR
jgi:DNA-directed RNA polymerase subunit RPC12/RpoP